MNNHPPEGKKRLILAVAGPIAAGKNAASDILCGEGFAAADADKMVHGAIERAKDKIVKRFGREAEQKKITIIRDDGTVDRRALGSIVFASAQNTYDQEQIVHPVVNTMMNEFIDSRPHQSVVLNAALLFKTPVIQRCDAVIFVDAPLIIRYFRIKKRDNLPFRQIMRRFYAQKNIFSKYKVLNTDIYKVSNIRSHEVLRNKILAILKKCETKGR